MNVEQEKMELLKERFSLMDEVVKQGLVTTDWCCKNIFRMTEEQVNIQRELINNNK
jgi:hypothetical protein